MSVSGRLRARIGMLLIVGVCLLAATSASAESRQPAGSERQQQLARLASYDDASVAPGVITPGRRRAIAAALVGLVSVVIGGLALARARRSG